MIELPSCKTIKFLSAIIVFGIFIFGFTDPLAAQEPIEVESLPGQQVILRLDERINPFHVPPPEQAELGIQSANFVVNWNPGNCSGSISTWPSQAKTAFNYAVGIWASLLNSTQTIEVDACWRSDLGSGILGSAGPVDFKHSTFHFSGPIANTWYPIALANALANSDLNGADAEIKANFSSSFDWYYGIDGYPGSKLDFVSVVLHELGHGLGFGGSMQVDDGVYNEINNFNECNGMNGVGCWGYGSGSPFVYDRFSENSGGTSLLNASVYPNYSTSLGNVLTGGNIYFDGTNARAANSGLPVKLYAPSTWKPGSSYSHLDEIFNNTLNALMTYSLAWGESEHSPGPVTLGIFEDMGWKVNSLDQPDLKLTKRVIGSGHKPGDPVAFVLSIQNIGAVTATQIVVTDILSPDILSPSWDPSSSFSGISVQSGTYIWSLPDLPAGFSGAITVTGIIRDTLPEDFAILNSAGIDTVDTELSTNNNSSAAMVGGRRIYLPVVVKDN